MRFALLVSVFVVASCGLAYELIAAAQSSYLLGDSITQFSTVIGVYLFAMGVGSWLSKYITRDLPARFIEIEVMVGVIGGFSASGLFLAYASSAAPFQVILYCLVLIIGMLVGLEIPLVMRLLEGEIRFKDLVSQVLSFDYLGALAVSLLFPLVLAPRLGMARSALLFGLLNVAVALWTWNLFKTKVPRPRYLLGLCLAATALLIGGFAGADKLTHLAEHQLYQDEMVLAETTPYQRIVVTRWKDDYRLFLNGNLQFSSRDEYRYHEALVHPGLASLPWVRKVAVLGGGDGLAVREILKYPNIQSVTLVDLDPAMTRLFRDTPVLRRLNQDSLHSPKVKVVEADAFKWLDTHPEETFDFIVVDFPDPTNYALGKLYTNLFYRLLERHLVAQGRAIIQSTSPLYARKAFWTVVTTVESVGLNAAPYHVLVPSFGEWGYILVGRDNKEKLAAPPASIPVPTRFITPELWPALFTFPADMSRVPAEVNRLDNQQLVRMFESEWRQVIR